MATTSSKVRTFRGGEYVAALMAELSRVGIAQRIAGARDEAGLKQRELAELMHVHWRTIQDWESVKKEAIPWDRLDELAANTNVTKNWLLHGDEELEREAQIQRVHEELAAVRGEQAQMAQDLHEALALLRELGQPPREERRSAP